MREMRVVETGLCLGMRIRFYPVGLNLCSLFYSLPNGYFHVATADHIVVLKVLTTN